MHLMMVPLDIITEGYGRKRFNLTHESLIVDLFLQRSITFFPVKYAATRLCIAMTAR
jgi:hypothetical protein